MEARQFKVALLGAAGGIGQPLALLLKMNKLVSELSLYDIANVAGVAADLSHCNTPVKVSRPSCLMLEKDSIAAITHFLHVWGRGLHACMLSSCHHSQALFPAALTADASMQQIDCTQPVATAGDGA